jgi:predicted TPR repeat methyltransferase
MLDKAAELGLYDDLACADIVDWLAERPPQSCGLAVAADVLVYLGDLAPLFARVRRALRPGGLFALSCEALGEDDRGFALQPSNRFAHALDYVRRTAQAAGFEVLAAAHAVLREDHGRGIAGHLVLLRAA